MTTRTSLVALATLAALATTALAPTSASAWGAGHFGEMNNKGGGYGGTPHPAGTPPASHVPGATMGGGTVGHPGGSNGMPKTGSTSMPMPTQTSGGTAPTSGQNGQKGSGPWNPGMPGTQTR